MKGNERQREAMRGNEGPHDTMNAPSSPGHQEGPYYQSVQFSCSILRGPCTPSCAVQDMAVGRKLEWPRMTPMCRERL